MEVTCGEDDDEVRDGRVPCGEDQPLPEADRRHPRRDAQSRVQGSEEERRVPAAGLREAGPREPQGADGTESADRGAHQDSGEARVQVPSREEPEGRGAWRQEVGLEVARGASGPPPFPFLLSPPPPFRASGRVSGTDPCRTPRWPNRSSTSLRRPGPPPPTSPPRGAPAPRPVAPSASSAPWSSSEAARRCCCTGPSSSARPSPSRSPRSWSPPCSTTLPPLASSRS